MTASVTRFRRPAISYDSRDYEAIRDDLIRAIPFFTPEWTDHNATDLGIVLIELFSILGDGLHFYVDRTLFEGFWGTALKRESMAALAKLIDFELRGTVAATVDLKFTIAAALGGPLLIPVGTLVSTSGDDAVFFETTGDLTIPIGELEGEIGAREGKSETLDLLFSDGAKDQSFQLEPTDIIEGSLGVSIDEGAGFDAWSEVDSLFLSGPASKEFTTERDGEGHVRLIFGDGSTGKIPDAGSPIRVDVRRGGGLRGNVGPGQINTVVSTVLFGGDPVALTVTNEEAATGGEDEMSVEEARLLGPRSFKTLDRAVTLEDYETLAEGFPGIVKARAREKAVSQGTSCCCCGVRLTIAVEGGGPPSAQLKADLLLFLEEKKMIGTCVEVDDATQVRVDVVGTVHVGQGFTTAGVESQALPSVDSFFLPSSEFISFGTPVFFSDLVALLDGIAGVDHIDLATMTRRPEPVLEQWNGDATFSSFEVGDDALDESWTVLFTSPTTFSLTGSVSGLQPGTGILDVPFAAAGDRISFLVQSGAQPMLAGDRATFRTSPKLGNVPIDASEVPVKGSVVLDFVMAARPGRIC